MTRAFAGGGAEGVRRVQSLEPAGGTWWELRLDDGETLRLLEATVAALGLAVGAVLTGEQVARLRARAAVDRALHAGLRLLSYRARSRADLRRRLLRQGHDEAAVDAAVAELAARQLLDDTAFASTWAREALARRPAGARRLVQDLRSKGIDAETARTAAAEALRERAGRGAADEDAESALAREVVQRRVARGRTLADPREQRRVVDLLRRRGFSWPAIRAALRAAGCDPTEFT